jgi:flagellar biosynthesis/type III secretory pathway chaperone
LAYTLLQLRTLARQRADMENSQTVTDAELTNYINDSYGELYDLLVSEFEDYYLASPSTFTIASGANTSALPADFYKLRGLDFQLSAGEWVTVRQFNFASRNQRSNLVSRLSREARGIAYRVMGQYIRLEPAADAAGTYQLWYVPRFTRLTGDSDTMGDVLDFAEYVIIDAAIKMLIKEESDIQPLVLQKQAMVQRVQTMAKNRSVDSPERIADTSAEYTSYDALFPRSW